MTAETAERGEHLAKYLDSWGVNVSAIRHHTMNRFDSDPALRLAQIVAEPREDDQTAIIKAAVVLHDSGNLRVERAIEVAR